MSLRSDCGPNSCAASIWILFVLFLKFSIWVLIKIPNSNTNVNICKYISAKRHICWPLFRKGLPFYVICDYENTSATMWQLKRVHRQKIGQFWAWRQTDTKRGLGTWKSLGLAGIQGESGPVVRCTGPIRLGEGEGVAWLELILCDWSNLQGYCKESNSWMSQKGLFS